MWDERTCGNVFGMYDVFLIVVRGTCEPAGEVEFGGDDGVTDGACEL